MLANSDVALTVLPGEIHAVLGENGAGKSTLMKIIYGALKPDAGTVMFNGQPVHIRNPQEARALGISMVFQHFSLLDGSFVIWKGPITDNSGQIQLAKDAVADDKFLGSFLFFGQHLTGLARYWCQFHISICRCMTIWGDINCRFRAVCPFLSTLEKSHDQPSRIHCST